MMYTIAFTRYLNGQLRKTVKHVQAEDFNDVYRIARAKLDAYRDCEPNAKFEIHTIQGDHVRAEECMSGWMTQDEFTAYAEAKNAK